MLINSKQFHSLFSVAIKEEQPDLKISYNSYSNNDLWTKYIESVYVKLYQVINSNFHPEDSITLYCKGSNGEFNHIDASFWIEENKINADLLRKIGANSTHNKKWKPVILIEHENDKSSNLFELKQLLFMQAPLRVLISYSDHVTNESKNDSKCFEKFKSDYLEVFRILEENMSMHKGHEFLFMFGCTSDMAKTEGKITYKSFYVKKNGDGRILPYSELDDIVIDISNKN